MSTDSVCRLCLTVDARVFSLIPIQEMYEKVTNNRLHISKRPVEACYICYAQLKRCYKFILRSAQTENTLAELLQIQTEITPKSIAKVDRTSRGLVNSFAVTPVKHEDFPLKPIPEVKTESMIQEVQIKVEFEEEDGAYVEGSGDNSEDENVPLKYMKVEKSENPGSSNAVNIPKSGYDAPLPLEVNVTIEDDGTNEGSPLSEFRKRQPKEVDVQDAEENFIKTSDDNYQCKICSKIITNHRYSLYAHLRMHEDEKPYECNDTERRSSTNSMKNNVRSPTGEKPTKCHICHRVCSTASNLKKHLRTHTGEKPYQCTVCSRKFSQLGNLKMHLRTHTGEKPFICKICNFEFRLRGALIRHEITHTGEKPFECEVCHRTFGQMSTLTRHKRKHTGERPFECHLCDWRFADSSTLRRHLSTHIDND